MTSTPPPPSHPAPEKKVRVRIAVAVQGDGNWYALGYRAATEGDLRDGVLDSLGIEPKDGLEHVVYVEADCPLPTPQTIQGEVAP